MRDEQPLAYCQDGHRLAWLVRSKTPEIHYWVAVAGLALREPGAVDDGHYNYGPHESVVPLETAERGRREVMCKHRHGAGYKVGELDFADLHPVISGESSPLTIRV